MKTKQIIAKLVKSIPSKNSKTLLVKRVKELISQFSLDQDDWNECYTYFESQGYSHEECLDRANEREGFTTEESAAILRIFHVLGQGGFGLDWTPVRGKDSIVRRETLSWRERADLQDENYGEWVGEMTVFTQLFN